MRVRKVVSRKPRARGPLPAAALLTAAALAGCGGHGAAGRRSAPATAADARADAALKARGWASAARLEAERARRLRAELRRLARATTVEAALRRALLAGHVTPAAYAALRRDWARAQATLGRLAGTPRAELSAVVGSVAGLAARHLLTADRIDPLFLTLRRNTAFWARGAVPPPAWRTTFGDDPVIFQYYPGHGLAVQPLASWGRASALARACLAALRAGSRHPCPARALRRRLDRLAGLAARRSGYLAWEYYFQYGPGVPPWVSGMTQATAVQALARGYRALGVRRWRRVALRALGAFEQAPPAGVSVAAPGGRHYLMYSFDPGMRILNGDLQAVIGLRDLATLARSRLAARLFHRGERAARRAVARFDTGAWSLYSANGAESSLSYHVLVAGFLDGLCTRTHRAAYCAPARRFHRYEREPTRIGVAPLRGLWARRATTVRFSLSKVSTVKVRLWGAGRLLLSRDLSLPRGPHRLAWAPPRRGRYRLRIQAQGPSGPLGVAQETIRVLRPKPKRPRHARRHRHGRRPGALVATSPAAAGRAGSR